MMNIAIFQNFFRIMKKFQISLCLILIIMMNLSLVGCFRVNYPDRTQYMFDIPAPRKIYTTEVAKALEVGSTAIAPQFSGSNFIYRVSDINYLTDYYNTFFIPPARQIDNLVTDYLNKTHLFIYVTNDDDFDHTHYSLHTKVLALYADYRNKERPKAVIAIQFTLFEPTEAETHIILNKTFRKEIPLSVKDSQSLMEAWDKGLERILERLSRDLYKLINM